jgi:hypothetical protein
MFDAGAWELSTFKAVFKFPLYQLFTVLDLAGQTGYRFGSIISPAAWACILLTWIREAEAAI